MKLKFLIPIIAMVSVLVMFLLQTAGVQQSWLAVFVGGILITIVSFIEAAKKEKDKDEDK